jgi:hypothetical protein
VKLVSSVVRPSGPLPPRVYWVRRLLLLAIVFLFVLLVWWLVGRVFGKGDPAEAAAPQPTAPAPSSSDGGHHRTNHHSKPGGKHHGTGQVQPTGACDPADIAVAVVVKDMNEGASNPVKLTFTSTAAAACTLAVTPDSLALRITSGQDLIWSSDNCPDELLATQLVVRRQQATGYTFNWDGYRSTDSCSAPGTVAKPGGYWAEAALIGAGVHRGYFDVKQ